LSSARQRRPDARSTVLLVGEQAVGTRGRAVENVLPVRIFGDDRATIA
jgi:hypothetical protein